MASNLPRPDGVRSSVKRFGHSIKKAIRSSSPRPSSSPQPPSSGVSTPLPTSSTSTMLRNHPTPTPTTHLTQPPATPASSLQKAKDIGSVAWAGLETALRVLEKSSDVFPPLKSAVSGLLACLDVFQDAAKRHKDYEQLASDLTTMVNDLAGHVRESRSEKMSECVVNVVGALQQRVDHISKQQERWGARRYAEAAGDVDDIIECYRHIETLFRRLQNNAVLSVWSTVNEQLADTRLKGLGAILEARYNSTRSTDVRRRGCTPKTREAVLEELCDWPKKPDSPNVYWMNGMAGTGKTTIAYSLCERLTASHQLGASFFCSRSLPNCRETWRIVPTIAYQLARFSYPFQESLCRALGKDPDIGGYDVSTQFDKLLRGPLLEVKETIPAGIVVVIDALDECSGVGGAQLILDVLFRHVTHLPIKFFVTCRPEPSVHDKLQSQSGQSRSVLHLHDIERSLVQADIETYLNEELSSTSLLANDVKRLAKRAGNLFIYAATAVRYIRPDRSTVDHHKRLKTMLSMTSDSQNKSHVEIDALYTLVLATALEDDSLESEEAEVMKLILRTVVCAREPMTTRTLVSLLKFEDMSIVRSALEPLRSVLHVLESSGLVSTLHASFPDYMLDRERSSRFFCDPTEHNRLLAERCFEVMKVSLKFNIYDLESSFVLDKDVPDLCLRAEKAIPPQLLYACLYWGDHLERSGPSNKLELMLEEFLSSRLLFWMKVLNLRQRIHAGSVIANQAHNWLPCGNAPLDTCKLAQDARMFVTAFGVNPVSRSTPHIYISMLPFWPKARPVRHHYWNRTRGLLEVEGSAMEKRDLAALAVYATNQQITAMALSPNGARIASASNSGTISIWDAQRGDLVTGPFKGHTSQVTSVMFSPDSARVVSGSYDCTIRIWDVQSGNIVAGPFEGHINWVTSVAFSPCGTRVASGSYDDIIRIWDVQSGDTVAGPFGGHTSYITSVAFSPDGARVAAGSGDSTIRIWDAQSGDVVVGPFRGHTNSVQSVAFSPEGSRVVSGSNDETIRIWDSHSGDHVAGPFEGHTHFIMSVVFSPDGARVFSGSQDSTIRIWDAQSGVAATGPFEGHTDWVVSVTFSPDGAHVVSGSYDSTICMWDAQSGDLVAGPFKGHTSSVASVAFSPDGACVVSGSDDCTIRIWDVQSGSIMAGPFKGHINSVTSVAFSPDGARVASGSQDETIRIWDSHSGDHVAGPFGGYTSYITSVAFSPDGARVASGSGDSTIRIWDVQSGNTVAGPFEGHTKLVTSVAFSPDGARVVSGSLDSTIRIWDAQSGDVVVGPFRGHTSSVQSVAFSPEGSRVVSGSDDSTIRIWDAQNGDTLAGPFKGHTNSVMSVAFSPDGARIVSGSSDHAIRVWDLCNRDIVHNNINNLEGWAMDAATGWAIGPASQLLFWVPPDLLVGLQVPQTPVVIYRRGSLQIRLSGLLLGKRWPECYIHS